MEKTPEQAANDQVDVSDISDRLGLLAHLSANIAEGSLELPEIEARLSVKALIQYYITMMLCAFLGSILWLTIVGVFSYSISNIYSPWIGIVLFFVFNLLALTCLLKRLNKLSEKIGFPRTLQWLSVLFNQRASNQTND